MVYYGLLLFFALEYIRPSSYFPALNAFHLNSLVPLAVLFGSVFTKKVKMPDVLGSPSAHWIMFLLFLLVISGLICDVKMYAITVFEMVLGYFFMFIVLKKEICFKSSQETQEDCCPFRTKFCYFPSEKNIC